MKKKHIPILIIAALLVIALASWIIVSRSSSDTAADTDTETVDENDLTESDDAELEEREEGNGIYFDEEEDGSSIERVAADVSDYYGDWEATSDLALYLYGSVYISVKDDGTWSATITGEPLGGDYEFLGDHMHMNDTVGGIFNFDLAFTSSGNLIMTDTESGEDSDDATNIVLTKQQ